MKANLTLLLEELDRAHKGLIAETKNYDELLQAIKHGKVSEGAKEEMVKVTIESIRLWQAQVALARQMVLNLLG